MKKLRLSAVILLSFFTAFYCVAQQQMPNIPLDKNVRVGKLDNGLTYYIRHNEWPEKRADFYIAQKVGSMQEEENQRGLAHFLEHMCFNGTSHFPGKGLISYLETIGVKFGIDLNAYTSYDETVYNINNVPVVTTPSAIDSCLYILHDWSHDLTLDGKEIDNERGVINEEWRSGKGAMKRFYENCFPVIFSGSRYGDRLPIGTMDVVMKFSHQTLRDYYRKWYRPDLQGIFVVGDVDVDVIEQKIKSIFSDIKPVENPAERVYFSVPDNEEPIFYAMKDKEQTNSLGGVLWKQETTPREMKSSLAYYVTNYVKSAIRQMLAMRLYEVSMNSNPPFVSASASYGRFEMAKTKDAFEMGFSFKDNGHEEALKSFYREILRAYRFGFTESEYTRQKEELKSRLERSYEQRNKIPNSSLASDYYRNFLDNEPAPDIEWEYQTLPQLVDQIPVAMINQAFQSDTLGLKNMIIYFLLPEKDNIVVPTKEDVLGYMKDVEAEDIEPYKEEISTEPLVDASTFAGSPVKKVANGPWDSKVLTLNNGIRIFLKTTDFTPQHISFEALSFGGTSQYESDEDIKALKLIQYVASGGVGEFSAVDLNKKMSGIQASCGFSLSTRDDVLSGSCVTKDVEYLLQLLYLNFTSPRRDDEAFSAVMKRYADNLRNTEMRPMTAFSDSVTKELYNNNIRVIRTKSDDVEKADYDKLLSIYKKRFDNAADFDFFFVGDFNIDSITPLLEKYIGSLPVSKNKEKVKPISMRLSKGNHSNIFQRKQETPMSYSMLFYHVPMSYNQKNMILVDALGQALDMLFLQTVREDEGGAYSVSVGGDLRDYPEKIAFVQIILPTAPEKREKMTEIILKGIEDIVNNGPKEEYVQKIREYLLRSFDEEIKTNDFWMSNIISKVRENYDFVTNYQKIVNSISSKDIQGVAKKIFNSGNKIHVSMTDDN